MSAAGKFFAIAAAIAIPVAVVYVVVKRDKKTGPTPNPATVAPEDTVDGTVIKVPIAPDAKLVGWFAYFGLWIRVEEFPDAIDTNTDSPHVKTASYKSRFRWTVFTSGKEVPLGTGTTEAEGTSWTPWTTLITSDDELLAEARQEAITAVVIEAATWINQVPGLAKPPIGA